MIRIYSWKPLAIAVILTFALCIGILYLSKWDVDRFTNSLGEVDPNSLKQHQRISNQPKDKPNENPILTNTKDGIEESITSETEDSDTESVENVKEALSEDSLNETSDNLADQEAAIDEFLAYLDELEQKEFDAILENLDFTNLDQESNETENETESEDIGTGIDQASAQQEEQDQQEEDDDIEDMNPSRMVVDMIESGVASLDSLIYLMEESSETMPEVVRDRFEPVLGTLRTMQVNGGRVVVHRPSEDPSDWMLLFINPNRTSRSTRFPIRSRGDGRVEFVPVNPRDRYIIIDERNSTIID
ncbi:hypothetical protein C6497_01130 [Candidatus Poribacteria bacterium]|nr:MAG: hypothetical protein C6497_01130 [Candidatus Poribacteria bacterium]